MVDRPLPKPHNLLGSRTPPTAVSLAMPHGTVPPSAVEGEIDWRRVWAALVRFRWLVGAVAVTGSAAGVAVSRHLPLEYVADATVWIDESGQRSAEPAPMRPAELLDSKGWADLLRSHAVLEDVTRAERLYLDVRTSTSARAFATFDVGARFRPGSYRLTLDGQGGYTLALATDSMLERGSLGDSIGRALGFRWQPAPEALAGLHTVQFALAPLREVARRMDDALDTHIDLDGSFLQVELRGARPARVAETLNALVHHYVAVVTGLRQSRLAEATQVLGAQADQAHQQLDAAEASLEQFDTRTITLPNGAPGLADSSGSPLQAAGRQDPQVAGFLSLVAERDTVHFDREILERSVTQGPDSGPVVEALRAVSAVQGSPDLANALKELAAKRAELRTLSYTYTDAYPPAARLREDIATLERRTIPALARGVTGLLAIREADIDRRLDAASDALRQIPARAITEARLRRAVGLSEALYSTLQQRYDAARVEAASTVPEVSVLDTAVAPTTPATKTASRVMLLAVCASLGLAVFGALLLDRVDPFVRYPAQVSLEMGLTILGAVPHVRGDTVVNVGAANEPQDDVLAALEGLRALCLNLVHAHGAALPLAVTVTSLGPGDGKSFITANLGRAFAAAGHRTLVIEGDVRRGRLDRTMRVARRPGLTDYLRGGVPLSAVLRPAGHSLLTLLPCGTRAPDAPELFGSTAMAELMRELEGQYDVLLVDSPPLTAAVDALVLARLTGDVALVLRTGYSRRHAAQARLDVFERLSLRLLGAILNDVPPTAAYAYEAYHYSLPGYAACEEPVPAT